MVARLKLVGIDWKGTGKWRLVAAHKQDAIKVGRLGCEMQMLTSGLG